MYQFIASQKEDYSVERMCKLLGVSRTSFYDYFGGKSYQISDNKALLSKEIKEIFTFHKRRYGSRRILEEMRDKDYKIGIYQVRSIMQSQGLFAIQPKSFVPKTTVNDTSLFRSPNLLLMTSNLPTGVRQVIVGDITYLRCKENGVESWLFLAVWMDLFSRRILAWCVDENMEASLVIRPMKKLILSHEVNKGFLVHTDGGTQYKSIEFRALLNRHQFRQSMTRKDNHYDNAYAESLFSRFKTELMDEYPFFEGLEQAKSATFEFIDGYYNTIRKHSAIEYKSPIQYENLLVKRKNENETLY